MIRVCLVDDHDVIRVGLKQILELDKKIKVIAEASRALDAIRIVESQQPDVVFMDIRMPGMSGIEATRVLKEKFPNVKVVLLTNFKEEEYVIEGLRAGAAGFLLKHIKSEELHKVVYSVLENKSVLDPAVTQIIIKEATSTQKGNIRNLTQQMAERLTIREFEILDLMSRGAGNKEIGPKLNISEYTVKYHIRSIFRKLGAKSRSEAVYKAVNLSLVAQKNVP